MDKKETLGCRECTIPVIIVVAIIAVACVSIFSDWPWLDESPWAFVGTVVTSTGVLIALYESNRTKRDQQIAKLLGEWSQASAIQSLLLRASDLAESAKTDSEALCKTQVDEIAREFDALNSVIAGQPGVAILINLREVAYTMKLATEHAQSEVPERMDAVLEIIMQHQPSLRLWRETVRRKLDRLGEPAPGFNN